MERMERKDGKKKEERESEKKEIKNRKIPLPRLLAQRNKVNICLYRIRQ